MKRKFVGIFLIAMILIGATLFQPGSHVFAEYACGTYGAGDFGSDCPDDAVTPVDSSSSDVTSSQNSATTPSGSTLTTIPSLTPTANSSDGTILVSQPAQQVNSAKSGKSYNWWPLIIAGIIIVVLALAIISYRRQKSR